MISMIHGFLTAFAFSLVWQLRHRRGLRRRQRGGHLVGCPSADGKNGEFRWIFEGLMWIFDGFLWKTH
jgi:hypothetical protein